MRGLLPHLDAPVWLLLSKGGLFAVVVTYTSHLALRRSPHYRLLHRRATRSYRQLRRR